MRDIFEGIKWFLSTLTFSRGLGNLGGEFLIGIIHWIVVLGLATVILELLGYIPVYDLVE